MTTPSTARLRALLDQSPPWPWAAISDPPYISITHRDIDDTPPVIEMEDYAETGPQPKHDLIALAPELAAEVIRLRKELTKLVEGIKEVERTSIYWTGYVEQLERLPDSIINILEGNNEYDVRGLHPG